MRARTHAERRDHGAPRQWAVQQPHARRRDDPCARCAITRAKESYLKLKIAATHQSYGTRCEQHRSVSDFASLAGVIGVDEQRLSVFVSWERRVPRKHQKKASALCPVAVLQNSPACPSSAYASLLSLLYTLRCWILDLACNTPAYLRHQL